MINPTQILEHMEVVGSDGTHVGTVDKLVVKLTKSDSTSHGEHHVLAMDAIESVSNGKLILKAPAEEARKALRHISS